MEFLGHKFTTTSKGLLANLLALILLAVIMAVVMSIGSYVTGATPENPEAVYDPVSMEIIVIAGIFSTPLFAFVLLKIYGFLKEGTDYKSLAASYFLLSFITSAFSFSLLYFMQGYDHLQLRS